MQVFCFLERVTNGGYLQNNQVLAKKVFIKSIIMLNNDSLKRNRLAVIAGDYPAPGHMMLVFVQQLVHAMLDYDVEISVVAPQSIVHAIVHREKPLQKVSKQQSTGGHSYWVYRPYILSIGNFRFFRRIIGLINRYIISKTLKKLNFNLLYAHFWSSAQWVSEFSNQHGIPLFVACGEGDNALEDMVNRCSAKELKALKASVKGVISVSSENARKCIAYDLVEKNNIVVLPNCVDTELFRKRDSAILKKQLGINESDFVIAFVGGFIPRKGPDRLAEAIKRIGDPSIKSIFIGRPFPGYPFDFDCPGLIFKGLVNHEEIPDYLSCADIFVLPTQKEGCCNAIVEALAMGLPVISSNGSFNDDIIDSENSIRINPDNVQEIEDAIVKLRDNKELRERMSTISKSRNDYYSVKGRAKKILDFITDHLE